MNEQSPRRGMASRVAFVGGGGQFLSADHVNASVRIWSRSTATEVATLEGHRILNMRERKGAFSSVGGLAVIGPQGQFAITCGIDGRVIRWDLGAQLPIRSETPLRDRQAGWTALGAVNGQLPAEASHIVVGNQAGDLVWLDPETLEERHRVIAAHKGAIRAIALGPGGRVATGGEEGAVLLWTRRDGDWSEQGEILRPAGGGSVRCLAFAADGAQLLVGGEFPNIEFWSLPERRLVREAAGHAENGGQQIALCAIPLADRGFLTGGTDGRVIEWNAADGARRREFSFQTTVAGTPALVRDMALDPAERSLLVSLADGTLEEVEFLTGKPWVRGAGPNYRFNTNLIEADLQVGLSADGGTIVLGSDQPEGALALWQTSDLLACRYVTGLDELRDADGDFEAPTALALSPKADLIALGTAAGEVVVRTSQGELVWRERLFQDSGWDRMTLPPIVALRFSPAGAQLVALLKDGRLVAWQVQEGRQQWSQAMATEARLLQHISEDLLVTAGVSGRIRVWNTAAGELVREWGTPGDAVTALLVSRDQEELVTGNDQGLISTWEVASGALRKQFAMPGVTRRFAPYSSEVRQPPERSERPRRVLGMAQWGKPTELSVLLGDGSLTLVDIDAQVVLARTLVHEGVAYKFGDRLNWSCEVFLDSLGRLCTVSSDRTIRRWQLGHVRPGTRLVQLEQKEGLMQLEASQQHGWSGLVDGQKLVCQPGNLAQPAWEQTRSLEGDRFLGFTQFPDGRIAAGRRRGPALVWNPGDGSVQECPAKRLEGFDALAAASPRDNLVATMISPTAVVLWKLEGDQTGPPAGLPDADLKRVLVQFNPATDRTIRVLQFSPTGDQLLAVTELGELVTWKVEGVNLALEGYGHKMPDVKETRYSPDGRRVFQVGAMGVMVWDPRNLEQPVATFNWHEPALFEGIGLTRHVHSVAWSSDGEWLATTGQDGTVRLGRYDTEADKPTLVATLGLNDLAVAASADNSGATLAEQLRRLSQVTFFVRFSADDKQLVLVSEERSVGLVDLEAVLAWGRGDEPRIWEELGAATGMRMWPDQTIQILDRNRLR
jgi:WD40 repeat protein